MLRLILAVLPVGCCAILAVCSVHAIIMISRFSVPLSQAHLCIFTQFIVAPSRPRTQFIITVVHSISHNLSSRSHAQFCSIYCRGRALNFALFIIAVVCSISLNLLLRRSSAHLHCCACPAPILIIAPVERPSSLSRRFSTHLHCCAHCAPIFIVALIEHPSSLLPLSHAHLHCRAGQAPIFIAPPVSRPPVYCCAIAAHTVLLLHCCHAPVIVLLLPCTQFYCHAVKVAHQLIVALLPRTQFYFRAIKVARQLIVAPLLRTQFYCRTVKVARRFIVAPSRSRAQSLRH